MKAQSNSVTLALVPLAIALNIVVGQLVVVLKLPVYLDSIGTVLTGALLGPWVALLTGALTNVIWTGLGINPPAIYFSYVAAIIGLLAGFAGRWGVFRRAAPRWLSALVSGAFVFGLTLFVMMFLNSTSAPDGFLMLPDGGQVITGQPLIFIGALVVGIAFGWYVMRGAGYAGLTGLLTGVVAGVISAPMAAYVFGGVTGGGTDLLVAVFRASGANILAATFAQGAVSDPFDKMTSFLLVWFIVQALPDRLRQLFPNTRIQEAPAPAAPKPAAPVSTASGENKS